MPEGDAVWRTARRLHGGLTGHVITDFELRWGGRAVIDLRGRRTLAIVPRGKHLLHRVEGGFTLHSHLRMEGTWRVVPPARVSRRDLANPHLRALVGCARATALGLQLGMLDVVRTDDEDSVVGHLGPDLLGDDWDAARAVANLRSRPERHLGAALLDQRNLAGIGTIWNAETLFLAGLWPWTPVADLSDDRLREVVDRAHALLTASLAFPWSVSTGNQHEPTYAHSRQQRPCRRCGTRIAVGEIGEPPQQRPMFYCPRCQAPAD